VDHDLENSMVVGADDEYEQGVGYWLRGKHKKVDPDMRDRIDLPHDDDKPAYDKTMAG